MMRRGTIAAVAAAAASLSLGWWTAAVIGGLYGLAAPSRRAGREAGLAVAVAWGGLLAVRSVISPIGLLATLLGGVIPIGAAGLLVATVVFGALLGGCAATVAAALRRSPTPN